MSKTTVFLILILIVNLFLSFFFESLNNFNPKSIIIKPGMSLDGISKLLHKEKVIKNPYFFKFWIKINFLEKKLRYGEFSFNKENSIFDVTRKLIYGKTIFRQLTIIEGSYKYDLLEMLKKIDPNTSLNILDIPSNIVADTYYYQVTDSGERILEEIKKLSNDFSEEIWLKRDKSIPLKKISEIFILASIIEKETSLKEEKSIIAGIFFNRLEKKMRLQSDPTVLFSITKGKKKLERRLTRKDLKYDSEFNTYKNHGLPPSIICFPGKDSLVSVTLPFESDLLYFVAKNQKGEHYFSSSYKEHLNFIKELKNEKK